MTAGRGRGKSAALGLAVAAAVAHGYANIFLTAPSPENLGTVRCAACAVGAAGLAPAALRGRDLFTIVALSALCPQHKQTASQLVKVAASIAA